MSSLLKNSFLTESENFSTNNILFYAVESLYSYIMLVTWGSLFKLNVTVLNCVNKGIRGQLLPVMYKIFSSTYFELGSTYKGKTVPLKIDYGRVSYLLCGLHIHWSSPQSFVSLLFPTPFCGFWYGFPKEDGRFPKKGRCVKPCRWVCGRWPRPLNLIEPPLL